MVIFLTIVGLSFVVLAHEFGHFITAKLSKIRVDEFGFGFPPRLFARKFGETTYSVNALLFGGFVKIYGEEGEEKDPSAFNNQPVWRRTLVTCGGVLANVVIAWLFFSVVFMAGAPEHLVISDVAPGSPAATAGMVSGDIIQEARWGKQILTAPVKVDTFVAMVKEAAARNESVMLAIRGAGAEEREVSLVPRANPPAGEGALGVGLAEAGVPRTPFFRSFLSGAEETWVLAKLTVLGLVDFFGRAFSAPGTFREMMGPVGIAAATAAQATTLGFSYLLRLLGFISLNLAILNLIPFPALDGGRTLFLLIEKLKGSPLPVRLERAVNAAGFVCLLLLMVLVTVQDVGRL
ncbi:MAG: site-2 protease family protein [Candidatus Jorgensenbacteria bacterium]